MPQWVTKITPDNITELIEYGARFDLNLKYLHDITKRHAKHGEDTYLMVYNPASRTSVVFYTETGTKFRNRYIAIPIYHPEGHFQQFIVNH